MPSLKEGEVDLGTSIMAVQYADGVILGADSRTTTGSYIANRVTDKLTQLHERIYCCRSGSAADTQAIADITRYYLQIYQGMHSCAPKSSTANDTALGQQVSNNNSSSTSTSTVEPSADDSRLLAQLPKVETAAALFRQVIYQERERFMAAVIVAGWDPHHGPAVYSVPLGGSMHRLPFAIGGSGSTYIYGYCDANYRPGMSKEECIDFVVKSLALAMSRDGSSGGVIRLAVIDRSGVQRHLISGSELPTFWQG